MKLSLNWIKELLNKNNSITDEDIIKAIEELGYEIENVSRFNSQILSNAKVVRVLNVKKHPNADKLSLCDITDGKKNYTVVCGAPNVYSGMLAAYMAAGNEIYGGIKIEKRKIRGIESEGMLCSAKELNLYDDHSKIIELDESCKVGESLSNYFDDTIIEIVTPANRYDCLSHIVIAKELKIKFGLEVSDKIVSISYLESKKLPFFDLKISSFDLCKRYIAINMSSVNNRIKLPLYITNRLNTLGIRSINTLVDISNYVMLEVGHSTHIFDLNKLVGDKIYVRTAKNSENINALDGKNYVLDEDIIVIADEKRPIAIAGIVGSEDTAVDQNTSEILIESAVFNRSKVRLARKKLGISTEASYRFERGSSFLLSEIAAIRVYELIEKYCGGKISRFADEKDQQYYNDLVSFNYNAINVNLDFLDSLLGVNIDTQKFIDVMQDLGGKLKYSGDNILTSRTFLVVPPLTRQDIKFEADIAEEIMRLTGYDQIPETLPLNVFQEENQNNTENLKNKILPILTSAGLNEVVNYSIISKKENEIIKNSEEQKISVLNPVSSEYSELRLTLFSGLVKNLLLNYHNQPDESIGLFEIGKIFYRSKDRIDEEFKLGVILCGKNEFLLWKNKVVEYDYYFSVGILEKILDNLGVEFTKKYSKSTLHSLELIPSDEYFYDTVYFLDSSQEKLLGFVGEINKDKLKLKITSPVFYCEVILKNLIRYYKNFNIYKKIPKYPYILRDLCLVIPRDIDYYEIESNIKKFFEQNELSISTKVVDYYNKDNITSITLSLKIQSSTKTLTDEEIENIMKKLINSLNIINVQLRQKYE
ncbi:MAG: phenylalanine--tRNA ligase subunit beta [Endomicrobia bacterium]|nr:phenylalanine--tRNA ligase subunit beta [Endomicrobiia bacterium]